MKLLLEAEDQGSHRSLLRISLNGRAIANGLTTAQAHLLIGEILERFALPGKRIHRSDIQLTGEFGTSSAAADLT
jgi:hypothetical protein